MRALRRVAREARVDAQHRAYSIYFSNPDLKERIYFSCIYFSNDAEASPSQKVLKHPRLKERIYFSCIYFSNDAEASTSQRC